MSPVEPLHPSGIAMVRSVLLALALCAAGPALATFDSVSLATSVAAPQRVGTVVTLQATPVASDPSLILYRFEVRTPGGEWRLLQDFRARSSFDWVTLSEDNYELRVLAVEEPTDVLRTAALPYALVSPGVIANAPVIYPTAHPLVVMASAPACAAGGLHRVRAWVPNEPGVGHTTEFKSCRTGRGVNHYVAGLRQNTDYALRTEVFDAGTLTPGAVIGINTGNPGSYVQNYQVLLGPSPNTSFAQPVHLMTYIARQADGVFARAVDITGRMLWSFGTNDDDFERGTVVRPVDGGTFLVLVTEDGGELAGVQGQFLREINLAGQTIRETNIPQINRQLEDLGETQFVGSFHHEARRLPDGRTAVLLSTEKILTDVQGPGDVDVYGEAVAVLDHNFQVVWYWDAFEHIDNTRAAILGEVCTEGRGGCPPLFLAEEANDWLHMNAIGYSAADGNLILSARHLDAVFKIDYADGNGNGDIVWELGEHGDFTLNGGGGDWPWFSHQHDSNYTGGFVVVHDNGNTRQTALGEQELSRGQVFILDETNLIANLVRNFDLGTYSPAGGSAQGLINGNFHFLNGFLGTQQDPLSAALELTPGAAASWVMGGTTRVYRSFRMRTLHRVR